MKVAVAIDNRSEISCHFERSPAFLVFTVENGETRRREIRANDQAPADPRRGPQTAHSNDHKRFVDLLGDCQAVIGLGIGAAARHALESGSIQVRMLSAPCPPEAAAIQYESGLLESDSGHCCGGISPKDH